jgi:hypothetical protein
MRVDIGEGIEFEFFEIEGTRDAEVLAGQTDGVVYSRKTAGRYNWFQKGYIVLDVLGLSVLPKGLPDLIDLPDDIDEE